MNDPPCCVCKEIWVNGDKLDYSWQKIDLDSYIMLVS